MDLERNLKVLLIGASGDLGYSVLEKLSSHNVVIGAHYFRRQGRLEGWAKKDHQAKSKIFQGDMSSQTNCRKIVQSFVKWAKDVVTLPLLNSVTEQPAICHGQYFFAKSLWVCKVSSGGCRHDFSSPFINLLTRFMSRFETRRYCSQMPVILSKPSICSSGVPPDVRPANAPAIGLQRHPDFQI